MKSIEWKWAHEDVTVQAVKEEMERQMRDVYDNILMDFDAGIFENIKYNPNEDYHRYGERCGGICTEVEMYLVDNAKEAKSSSWEDLWLVECYINLVY